MSEKQPVSRVVVVIGSGQIGLDGRRSHRRLRVWRTRSTGPVAHELRDDGVGADDDEDRRRVTGGSEMLRIAGAHLVTLRGAQGQDPHC
jgi:hypothetical protein